MRGRRGAIGASTARAAARHLAALVVLLAAVLGLPAIRGGTAPAAAPAAVTGFSVAGGTAEISAGPARAKVIFLADDVFRIMLAPNGEFTDPANSPPEEPGPDANIVTKRNYPLVNVRSDNAGLYHRLMTGAVTVRVYKTPLRFALYGADDRTRIWEEVAGPTLDPAGTTQVLLRGETEQFFGAGMQNGRFSHRDQVVEVSVSYDWEEGGHPNSVPFYLSTAGYGVLRNTFAPGQYAFTDPVITRHEENRFDAYYFAGDLKHVIDRYTELTGRPFMPPVYGLELTPTATSTTATTGGSTPSTTRSPWPTGTSNARSPSAGCWSTTATGAATSTWPRRAPSWPSGRSGSACGPTPVWPANPRRWRPACGSASSTWAGWHPVTGSP